MHTLSLIGELLFKPKEAFQKLEKENPQYPQPIIKYALPFILLGAVSNSFLLFMETGFTKTIALEIILNTLVTFLSLLFAINLVNSLAPRYKALAQKQKTTIALVYGLTPLFVISIIAHFFLEVIIVQVLGVIISIFTLSYAFKIIMKVPSHMSIGFTILAVMLFLGVNFFFSVVISNILAFL